MRRRVSPPLTNPTALATLDPRELVGHARQATVERLFIVVTYHEP